MEKIKFYCRFRLLGCISNDRYEIYGKYKITREFWIVLNDAYSRDNERTIRSPLMSLITLGR